MKAKLHPMKAKPHQLTTALMTLIRQNQAYADVVYRIQIQMAISLRIVLMGVPMIPIKLRQRYVTAVPRILTPMVMGLWTVKNVF